RFTELFSAPVAAGGFNLPADRLEQRVVVRTQGEPAPDEPELTPGAARDVVEMVANTGTLAAAHASPAATRGKPAPQTLGHGDVLIAAITSCTNTSNPGVLLAAGLLAKKAVEAGLKVAPHIKTSLAPGSRIVTEYLTRTGLLPYLEKLGFAVAAYGCTTCIGNSGPLPEAVAAAIEREDLVASAVLSGNRNF
ncbi:MAG: hypothetical protein KDA65_19995, partial [Planctomycetaceae bacterium]|nr:hypothetical protein [Planctomycetaceae bacterium]